LLGEAPIKLTEGTKRALLASPLMECSLSYFPSLRMDLRSRGVLQLPSYTY
jgi:hypothetical protein